MALIQVDFVPGESVWAVDAANRVLAGTIHSVSLQMFVNPIVSDVGDPDTESPYETTTTTAAPTTTVAPTTTTTAPPSSSPPLVTTTAPPTSSSPSTTPSPSTTAPPASTLPPEPIVSADDVVTFVSYQVRFVTNSVTSIVVIPEDRVFATVEEAVQYVTDLLQ